MTFNILQWNIRGLRANLEELLDLTKRCSVGIMAIQDSKLSEGWAPPRGFQLLSSEDPSRGASLFIGNSMRATKLNLNTNLVAVAARIFCPKAVTVCCIYLLPGENMSRNSFIDFVQQLPKPYIILGDFNVYSPLWGDERLDQRGKMIEDFLISNDDILLNDKVPTFIHSASGSTSAIDLIIASPTVALDYSWSVHDDLCGSDHFPIILSCNTNVGQDDATFNF
ncbi:RNA-directed DNA polymerase from mobile element jockey [Elysia marginata]|uniref:RNA-directed DNA polymerase from mobile element jockey n=1 Tax=Elysia marginata TaxID=1093978 RepID=A0AAV4F622_9GAST|nr:RNA-directed DNA polymerase from mobile element jockey [Elysia marginata]